MEEIISIIIPVFNAEKYILNMLESIKGQTYKNFEIIVIDDGSTDKSVELCKKFKEDNKKIDITILSIENAGVSNARNEGIKIARGKFIVFVDADDIVNNRMLENLYKMVACGYDCVIAGYKIIEDQNIKIKQYKNSQINSENVVEILNQGFFNPLWNKIYKKEIIDKKKISFDTNLTVAEDLDFNLQYLMCCNSVYMDSTLVYDYYIRKTGANKKIRYDAVKNCIDMNYNIKKVFKKLYNLDQNQIDKIDLICLRSIFRRYKLWIKKDKGIIKNINIVKTDFKKIDTSRFDFDKSEKKELRKLYYKIKSNKFYYVILNISKVLNKYIDV